MQSNHKRQVWNKKQVLMNIIKGWRQKVAHPGRSRGRTPCTPAAVEGQQTQIWWPCPEEAPAPGGWSGLSRGRPAAGHQIAWPWPLPGRWTFWTPTPGDKEKGLIFLAQSSRQRRYGVLWAASTDLTCDLLSHVNARLSLSYLPCQSPQHVA